MKPASDKFQVIEIKDFDKYVSADNRPILDSEGNVLYESEVLGRIPDEEARQLLRGYFYAAIEYAKNLPAPH